MPIKKLANYVNKTTQYGGFGKMTTGLSPKITGNQMYDSLYKANPYVGLTYNKSAWQGLLSGLGFRTDYDRWLEEAQTNAAEYDAQVASIQQQNEYNSPAQEAARMRQAGLNPDLTGVQGVAESASPIQDPQGMSPGSPESGEFGEITQKIWNFGTTILSMYQVGVGLAKDMLSFKQMKNAVDSQDVQLSKDFMDFADDFVKNSAPAYPFENDEDLQTYVNTLSHWSMNFPKKMHFNRRQRRIWNSSLRGFFTSDHFRKMTEDWKQSSDNLTGVAKSPVKMFRTHEIGSDQFRAFNVLSSDLGDFAQKLYKIQQTNLKDVAEAGSATAKYDKSVSEARSAYVDQSTHLTGAQTQVLGEMSGHKLLWFNNQIESAMSSTLKNIVTDLERQANDGDLLSAGLLLAFQIFRMSNFRVGSKNFSASF